MKLINYIKKEMNDEDSAVGYLIRTGPVVLIIVICFVIIYNGGL